jgi:Flp pilus assembly protein TadG
MPFYLHSIGSNAMKNQLNNFGRRGAQRRGAITVLTAMLSVVLLGFVAFAVDVGYVLSTKQELQRAADAAALASCWEYVENMANEETAETAVTNGRATASEIVLQNKVAGVNPLINQNVANGATGDLVFGRVTSVYGNGELTTASPDQYNAVRVKVRRDSTLNGEMPFFFARVFHRQSMGLNAEATAAFIRSVSGFRTPSDALDLDTWEALLDGDASDNWAWDPETKTISEGPDGVLEVNLFPQGTGSPGNRGTVDIGSSNNSTADIARQIVYGISPSDLAHHGGSLDLGEDGEMELNGDTGISAGVKDELASIKGKPRLIPIFSSVCGPGNNAEYTIVHWAGIRIMDVKLTGAMNQKRVIVQPAAFLLQGAIESSEETSDFVYSPVVLIK